MTSTENAREQIGDDLKFGFAVSLKQGADSEAAARRYREEGGARETEVFDHAADGVNAVRGVLGGLAALLLFVGATSLVNAVANTQRERRQDLGILKAIGLTPAQVVGEVLAVALWLTAISLAIGLPLGLWISQRISDVMGNGLGWGPGLFETPPFAWVALIVPAMLALTCLAAVIPALVAARLPANEALRSE
jgi:putative ABC transport system permease protein